jgi:hypothetical protein
MSRREWRVPRKNPVIKGAAAVVFAAVAARYAGDAGRAGIATLAAVLLAAFALRDVLLPVRLAADSHGVTVVHGFGRRDIPWAEVERVRVDARTRLGRRDEVLEVDTGESLYLFGAAELGADCDRVAATLVALRTGTPVPD